MATHDYVISNGTGSAVRSDINGALAAIVSQNSNASAPATTYAYMSWADTSAGVMKMRNGANSAWISLYELDGTFLASDISLAAGSAAAPSLFFTGDTNTGLFSPGADTVALATAGSNRLHISSGGLVGIGTIAPTIQLQVLKDPGANNANNGAINLCRTSTVGSTLYHTYSTAVSDEVFAFSVHGSTTFSDTTYTKYLASAGGVHVWYGATTATERARIDSSGRLLVGTSSARANFYNSSNTSRLQVEGTSGDTGFSRISAVFNDNSANGDSIIIGKTRGSTVGSATAVVSQDNIGYLSFQAADGTDLVEAASIGAAVDGTPGANDMPGRLVFSTTADGASSPTERMRINNTGSATINAAVSAAGGTHTIRDSGSSPDTLRLYNNTDSNNTGNRFLICDAGASILRAEIRTNGGLANFSANNANLSDRNAKKDISPAADTWNCVKEWEIVNYRYNDQPDDADLNLGVVAQQVAESCPEVITIFQEAKEATEDAPAQEERLGVKEQQMYWMAIKALQEAIARIETLETEVAALKGA